MAPTASPLAASSTEDGDGIDPSDLDADPTASGDQAFSPIGSAAFIGAGGGYSGRSSGRATTPNVLGTTAETTPGFEIVPAGNVASRAPDFAL